MSDSDWGVMPLANPGDLSDDPRFRGTRAGIGEDGKANVFSDRQDTTEGEGGPSGPRRGGAGGTVNLADAERARAAAIWARKEADGAESQQHHSDRRGMVGTRMSHTAPLPAGTKAQPHNKPMTHEQLMAKAKAMLDEQNAQKEAQLAQGPAAGGELLPHWLVSQGY